MWFTGNNLFVNLSKYLVHKENTKGIYIYNAIDHHHHHNDNNNDTYAILLLLLLLVDFYEELKALEPWSFYFLIPIHSNVEMLITHL